MTIIKLPTGFEPPTEVIHEQYILEPLAPKHNEIDYEAWTSSKDDLKGIFGPRDGWPGEVTSLEQNLSDHNSTGNQNMNTVLE